MRLGRCCEICLVRPLSQEGPVLPPTLAWKQKGPEEKERRSSYLGLGGEVGGPSQSRESSDTLTPVSRPAWPPTLTSPADAATAAMPSLGEEAQARRSQAPTSDAVRGQATFLPLACLFLLLFSRSVMSDSLRPLDRSMPGLPVLRRLLEFAQTRVHLACDTTQPSQPPLSPSPPALNLTVGQ